MKVISRRMVAYIIDIMIVSIVSTLITSNVFINKDYNNYINTYKEYENFYEEYEDSKEELQELFEDNEITDEEYETKLEEINSNYNNKNIDYNYKLIKLSIVSTILSILIILLYFVVIQYYMGGQTLGKKIMKLRIVSNNNKELKILNYLLRCLILNSVLINVLNIIFVLCLSKDRYLIYNQINYVLSYAVEMTIILTMIFNKDNRGLQDLVANSKVVEVKENTSSN